MNEQQENDATNREMEERERVVEVTLIGSKSMWQLCQEGRLDSRDVSG